jgi:GntR family transcriptional repressor for pyruvate dehydrogenase complex
VSTESGDGIEWGRLAARQTHLPDDLAASLEQMIADGRLAKGARIPAERDLAAAMGVSRASVRAALRELELKGLIDRRPGRGTIVTDNSARREVGNSLLGRLDPEDRDLLEVMDLRAAIEPPIAARAASRATAADVRRLREIADAADRAKTLEEIVDLDERFHQEISRTTHNPLLVRLLEVTTEWMGPSRRNPLQTAERRRASTSAHRAVLDAIGAHDPEAAAAAMARHIASVDELLTADIPGAATKPRPATKRRSGRAPR